MSRFDSPLDNIKIASPCSANWDEMFGNDQKRFCGECNLNVYNLSGMSKLEAENLLMGTQGRLCVKYYKRSDGTILTTDCPVGWEMVKRRLSVCTTAAFSMMLGLFSGLFSVSLFTKQKAVVGRLQIPYVNPAPNYEPLMGAVAMPSPTQQPSPEIGEVRLGKISHD